ncbi:MAG TPA: prepilin-type N-terminal cleavage/methylation domain-containing protein [Planctomycetota bacterium]|nr:prepilin-type N-terminal cleavage/methylation domain-containing protein [Planctomycetota bacterium]
MRSSSAACSGARQDGFTLLEVLVALAVLAIATLTLTGMRTTSVIDAAEARNARIAREIASGVLSKIEAGVIRAYELRGTRHQVEELPLFEWMVVIGETEIQEAETEQVATIADASGSEADRRNLERQEWLTRRREIERARAEKKALVDLEREELEVDESPDEDTIEEIAIFVYWPRTVPRNEADLEGMFRLRGQASTLALSGLTTEQAEARGGTDNEGGETK